MSAIKTLMFVKTVAPPWLRPIRRLMGDPYFGATAPGTRRDAGTLASKRLSRRPGRVDDVSLELMAAY